MIKYYIEIITTNLGKKNFSGTQVMKFWIQNKLGSTQLCQTNRRFYWINKIIQFYQIPYLEKLELSCF